MNSFINISINDFRSTFREHIFKALLLFPFLSFLIIRWGVPVLTEAYPDIYDYRHVILMWACMQSAIMFGFIYGFLFLEEKEENIWQAILVLPVSSFRLTLSRLLVGMIVSVIVNFIMIRYGGIAHFGFVKEVLLAIQFSFVAPLIALLLGAFAKNRIEGLAQMKIMNLLLVIPAFIYIFPYKVFHVLAIFPTYWSFRSMEKAGEDIGEFTAYFVAGVIIYIFWLYFLNSRMKQS
jgi:fluoroquinolone transport system permease protein